MTAILLATGNPAKLARLRWLLDGLELESLGPADVVPEAVPEIPEDGADFAANAAQKAGAWSLAVPGILALASDGGMHIPALGHRWDALRTRRNAGTDASDADRIEHLLELMRDLHGDARRAIWHEALALAQDGMILHVWSAEGDGGTIVEHPPPDPVVDGTWTEHIRYYPRAGKRYCNLSAEEARALDLVWPRLRADVHTYFTAT